MTLPIAAILDDLLSSLEKNSNAVLIAPPGAGKTTNVAPALMHQSWAEGQILLLSPRRLATRMAAHYIAKQCGEEVGKTIGYMTRGDSKLSADNKIIVMTEGIFLNKIINDPELSGVSAVLFDEVHERSLDSDFGLALALEAQTAFRPDMRLVAMSATLDGERFVNIMGDAPLFQSEGKSYPLNIHYLGRRIERSIEEDIAGQLKAIVRDYEGDILIFLPGAREIDWLANLLPEYPNIEVHKLHSNIDQASQRKAVQRAENGPRKIILATNIAETSLTIDGVRIVIDSGLVRHAHYNRAANITQLVTEKSSLASAVQRAGRAARQGEGHAFRLWLEAANGGLPQFDPPEILECDLSSLVLNCAIWGEYDPAQLSWLDEPPSVGIILARKQLSSLNLFDKSGFITPMGSAVSQLPMPPHLANMLLLASDKETAAMLIAMVQEHGLGGRDVDIEMRLQRTKADRSARAQSICNMAKRWSKAAQKIVKSAHIEPIEMQSIGAMIAYAFPDRVAKRQDSKGENWLGAGGKRYFLDVERSPELAQQEWIAISDVQGASSKTRIASAAVIGFDTIEAMFTDKISETIAVKHDMKQDRIDAGYERKLGNIVIAKGSSSQIEDARIADALLASVRDNGLSILPWSKQSLALMQRAQYAGEQAIADIILHEELEDWLLPIVTGKRRIAHIDPTSLHQALELRLGWDGMQRIKASAPSHFITSEGKYPIDYSAEGGPTAQLRVQALFGVSEHPTIGKDRIALLLSLTSPAGRPIQTTRNLPEFWQGSWHDVAKEMRGRYPKHHWPDDPVNANASLKTKKRQNLK